MSPLPWAFLHNQDPKRHFATANYRTAKGSFDHLVGTRYHCLRKGDPERLGSLEINHQLKLGRLLDWQVRWLRPFQDAVDLGRGLPVQVEQVIAVGHEPAVRNKKSIGVYRGQAVLRRERNDLTATRHGAPGREHDAAAIRFGREIGEGALDLRIALVKRTSTSGADAKAD